MRPGFIHHLHPPTVPAEQARWRHTLGAGGIAIFLVLLLGLTGILEMFYYVPDPEQAALSVQHITYHVRFGALTRNLHYWAAQLLVVVSVIHLLRVIFTAAYSRTRRFNYLLGLGLFVLVLMLDFTGYILRWDMDVCWPLVTGTNLLKTVPVIGDGLYRLAVGGGEACSTALIRFYTWHIFGLSIFVVILGAWHAFRVRRDGGIAVPPPGLRANPARISRDELLGRELLAVLLVAGVLIVLASLVPAPIAPAMTGTPPLDAEAQAPWFFLWVQKMLQWGDPFLFGIMVPLGLLALLALIPYVLPAPAEDEIGRWFAKSGRPAQILVSAMLLGVLALSILALVST
jgi:quinol-cytochrome oxidoreductase complex cytochrome b subunit